MRKRSLPPAGWILIAMVLGIVIGYMIFISFPDKKSATQIAGYVSIMSDVFLRLIKMIIAPLIFSTLVVGIAGTGDFKAMGRIGLKEIVYFEAATTIALFLGLGLVNLFRPGGGMAAPASAHANSVSG